MRKVTKVATAKKNLVCIAVLLLAGLSTAAAQNDGFSARTTGMGRTFSASSRGLDALGMNPANLALTDRNTTVAFTLVPPVGVKLASNFFTLDLYNQYFTGIDSLDEDGKRVGRVLTATDKADILGRMEDGMSHTEVNVNAMLFGAVVHAGSFGIGFSVNDHVGLSVDLPESYLKFAFYGLDSAGAKYEFSKTSVQSLWYREYTVSTGVMLPIETKSVRNVAFGVGFKVVKGFNYIATNRNNSRLSSTSMSDSMSITGISDLEVLHGGIPLDSTAGDNIMTPGGNGIGLDFGLSAEVFRGVRVGASVLNIGSIRWSGPNAGKIINTGTYSWRASVYDKAELDRVKDNVDSIFTSKHTTGEEFSTSLPTSVHIGASIDVRQFSENFPVPLNLAADVHFGVNDVVGNYPSTLVGLGAELNLLNGWVPIRMGVLMGGHDKFLLSGGIGFHFWNSFDLDLGTQSLSILTAPNTFKTGSFAMAMKVRI